MRNFHKHPVFFPKKLYCQLLVTANRFLKFGIIKSILEIKSYHFVSFDFFSRIPGILNTGLNLQLQFSQNFTDFYFQFFSETFFSFP